MKSPRFKILSAISLLAILVAIYFVLVNSNLIELLSDMDLLAVKARGLGFYGPLLLIALMTLAVVFSPLPSAPVALAAGAVYGHTYGTIYIVIGAEVGAIVDNEGEQYIAATDQGLFHSDDHGHAWVGYERSGRLHQEPVEQTRARLPGSKTHAVHAMTVILINFNAAEI